MKIKNEMKKVGMVAMVTLAMTTGLFAENGEKNEVKKDNPENVVEAPAYTISLSINGMMIELSPISVYPNNETDVAEDTTDNKSENEKLAMLDDTDSFYKKMRIEEAIENLNNSISIF